MAALASAGSSASVTGVPDVAVSPAVASSPALDHELRLQEERVGLIAAPSSAQSAQDQLERAQLAAHEPVAALQDDRVHCATSIPERLTQSISAFGATPALASEDGTGVKTACSTSISPASPAPLTGRSVTISSV